MKRRAFVRRLTSRIPNLGGKRPSCGLCILGAILAALAAGARLEAADIRLFDEDVAGKKLAIMVQKTDEGASNWTGQCEDRMISYLVSRGYLVLDESQLREFRKDAILREKLKPDEPDPEDLLKLDREHHVDILLVGRLTLETEKTPDAFKSTAHLSLRASRTWTDPEAPTQYMGADFCSSRGAQGEPKGTAELIAIGMVVEQGLNKITGRLEEGGDTGGPFASDLKTLALHLKRGGWNSLRRPDRLVFSPDDRHMAVADGKAVNVYRLDRDGKLVAQCNRLRSNVRCLSFNPQTEELALGCENGKVWIWDWVEEGADPYEAADVPGEATVLAWRDDGKAWAVGNTKGKAKVLSLSGHAALEFDVNGKKGKLHDRPVTAVCFVQGNRLFAAEEYGTMSLWDCNTGMLVRGPERLPGDRPRITCADVSGLGGDSELVALGVKDIRIDLLSRRRSDVDSLDVRYAATWDRFMKFEPHITQRGGYNRDVTVVAFSRWARFLVTGNRDGTVAVWDLGSGEDVPLAAEENLGKVHAAAISPYGRWLGAATSKGLHVWATEELQEP